MLCQVEHEKSFIYSGPGLIFGLSLHQLAYFVYASNESSGSLRCPGLSELLSCKGCTYVYANTHMRTTLRCKYRVFSYLICLGRIL